MKKIDFRSPEISLLLAVVFAALVLYFNFARDFYPPSTQKTLGPWPECSWMTGSECAQHIRSLVERDVKILELLVDELNDQSNEVSSFESKRVIVYVDKHGAVVQPPARG
ncbi:hypothetical protein ACA910_014894 [Epithemia clementina (nom. ined.)]